MTITAAMVKELRDATGAGMMDCKNALKENNGDMTAAQDWLRTKGIAKADKKAGRTAAEGLVGVATGEGIGALVEVNSETDFVARNEEFQKMVAAISGVALTTDGDVEALGSAEFPGAGKSVKDHLTEMVGTIGENMSLRRTACLKANPGVVTAYIHNSVAPGMGKIGVLVALESEGDKEKLDALGRQLAMHIAATGPLAVSADDLDQEVVERERNLLADEARESGKPENIIEKMIEGRIRKFYEEVVLLSQTFVIDGETKIEQVLKNAAGDVGGDVKVAGFAKFTLGEGIEKEEDDFAAEVAAAAGTK